MRSTLAVTYEVYDAYEAAVDLAGQVAPFFPLDAQSCGFLFAEPGYDLGELLPELSSRLPGVMLVGCTAMAQISSFGYTKLAATLLLLSGNDCAFGAAAVGGLDTDGPAKIRQAFHQAAAGLNGLEPQGLFAFSCITETYHEHQKLGMLHELMQGKPVFGGVASDYFDFSDTRVFLNGTAHERGMVLLLVGGSFSPRFVVRNLPKTGLAKHRVTKSEGLRLVSVDNVPAKDFLLRHGADISNTHSLFFSPLSLELDTEKDYDGISVCCSISHVDEESGAATVLADIPEGTAVSVQVIQGSDILDTTADAMKALAEEIRQGEREGHAYSAILIATCAARHVVLALDHAREASMAQELFPATTPFTGFYSYGEFCPTSIRNGRAKNRLHGLSIAICAL